jgi:hypothetical protein
MSLKRVSATVPKTTGAAHLLHSSATAGTNGSDIPCEESISVGGWSSSSMCHESDALEPLLYAHVCP